MTDDVHEPAAHRMKFGTAVHDRLTVEMDAITANSLLTIQDAIRRSSPNPLVPVSKSVATRRAINLYAEALSRQTDADVLKLEVRNATKNTYAVVPHKRSRLTNRDRKF